MIDDEAMTDSSAVRHNIMKTGLWWLLHALTWALLYGAFVARLEGALYVLKFYVWIKAILSPAMLVTSVIEEAAKQTPKPLRWALAQLLNWTAMGLLVWFGHVATGAALFVEILFCAAHRREVRKRRALVARGAA